MVSFTTHLKSERTTLNSAESQLRHAGSRLIFKFGTPPPGQFSSGNVRLFGFRGIPSLLSFFDFFLILPCISPCSLLSPLFFPSFFFHLCFCNFLPLLSRIFLSTQMNVFIVLFVTIENTNTTKALLLEVNICHNFLELLQTFFQLLRQQTDFGVFSSNV